MNLQTFVYQQAGNAIATEMLLMGYEAFCEKARKDVAQLPMKYRSVIRQHNAMAAIAEDQKER